MINLSLLNTTSDVRYKAWWASWWASFVSFIHFPDFLHLKHRHFERGRMQRTMRLGVSMINPRVTNTPKINHTQTALLTGIRPAGVVMMMSFSPPYLRLSVVFFSAIFSSQQAYSIKKSPSVVWCCVGCNCGITSLSRQCIYHALLKSMERVFRKMYRWLQWPRAKTSQLLR